MPKKPPKPEPGDRDEPVSLEGLDPVEALKALLAVDPDDVDESGQQADD